MKLNRQKLETELIKICDRQTLEQLSLYLFETVSSTNQALWKLIDGGTTPPLAAIAAEQTAGRGQWGRQWQSQRGGLYLSVAIAPHLKASDISHLTIFTAWGIADSLRRYEIPVFLKWPNDLILQQRKLGGIKSETRIRQKIVTHAVIGVGINWTNPVPEVGINLQSYREKIASLEQLAAIAIGGIFSGYQYYLSKGIEILLPSYLEFLESIGRKVTVNGCPGVVVGVNSQGELRVRLHSPGATTEITLPSGTISLGYDNMKP